MSIEEIGETVSSPKLFQLYVHKDKGLNRSMIERCKAAKFDAIALTVDTIVSGNRERCRRTGFSSPPRLTPRSAVSFAAHPGWTLDYLFREKFALPNLETHVAALRTASRGSGTGDPCRAGTLRAIPRSRADPKDLAARRTVARPSSAPSRESVERGQGQQQGAAGCSHPRCGGGTSLAA